MDTGVKFDSHTQPPRLKMHQDLPDVVARLDDMLVFSKTNETHLQALEAVLYTFGEQTLLCCQSAIPCLQACGMVNARVHMLDSTRELDTAPTSPASHAIS